MNSRCTSEPSSAATPPLFCQVASCLAAALPSSALQLVFLPTQYPPFWPMADRAHKFRFDSTVNPDIRCSAGMRVVRLH
eukprot:scaffold468_cov154-Skeletonema_marinoi.AAC.4